MLHSDGGVFGVMVGVVVPDDQINCVLVIGESPVIRFFFLEAATTFL